jgi:16S rRNA (uracil1498-N3)-methyltransferase
MHRFFVSNEYVKGETITIIGDDVSHISRVLRLRVNDNIKISNGNGIEYICSIIEISKKEVLCHIMEVLNNMTEAPVEITLFQGIPKSQKMDLIVQKCVEIGVVGFYPVITDRVVVKLEDRDIKGKFERWNRISEEAAKQSNRGIIPKVFQPIAFEKALELMKEMDLCIVPYENEKNIGLREVLKDKANVKKVGIFIGPEGGFELDEVKLCLDNNILPATLGPRILRTETAGFVAATIVQYELGDMGGCMCK